jgi:SNF2 family DNA or RNA helicase
MQFKLEPWAHQLRVINKIKEENLDYFALFHDMGSGKTKTSSEIYRLKCSDNDRLLRLLIICPIVVQENWKRELLAHTYIDEKEIQVIDGTSKVKPTDKELKNPSNKRLVEQLTSGRNILIINTEKVGNATAWQYIEKFKPEFLIVDEAHRFKDGTGVRTRALMKTLDKVAPKYRLILTGSPFLQSELDIWAQYYLLNPNILGRNFFSFRSEYFYDYNSGMPSAKHFPDWRVKDHKFYKAVGLDYDEKFTLSKLNEIIYKYADRVKTSEVLDLPPIVRCRVDIPLTSEQSKIYTEFYEDAVAYLTQNKIDYSKLSSILASECDDEEAMSADTALVKLIRLQQIIAGDFTKDNGEKVHLESNRYKILKDYLTEICADKSNKVIIWSVFASTYERIAKVCGELGLKYVFLTGKQSKAEKQASIDSFNNDSTIQIIIANQGAGGTGVNLTASNYSLYLTRSYRLEHDLQSEARNYRGGQKRTVTRIDFVTPKTVDEDQLLALADKKNMGDEILKRKEFTAKEIFNLLLKK